MGIKASVGNTLRDVNKLVCGVLGTTRNIISCSTRVNNAHRQLFGTPSQCVTLSFVNNADSFPIFVEDRTYYREPDTDIDVMINGSMKSLELDITRGGKILGVTIEEGTDPLWSQHCTFRQTKPQSCVICLYTVDDSIDITADGSETVIPDMIVGVQFEIQW